MDGKLAKIVDDYGGMEKMIRALQKLKIEQSQDEEDENEIIVEVWRGDSINKNVTAFLGITDHNRYFLLTGSQTSSEESDAATMATAIATRLDDLRANNAPQPNGTYVLAHDFLITNGSFVIAWKVALGTTVGAHRWIKQDMHARIGTPIQ